MKEVKRRRGAPKSNDGRTYQLQAYVKPDNVDWLDSVGDNRSKTLDLVVEFATLNEGKFKTFMKRRANGHQEVSNEKSV